MPLTELDALTSDPGLDAGRFAPPVADAGIRVDGTYVFCLGHDAPGFFGLLYPGDYVEVSQTGDFTGAKAITFWPRTRPPTTTPTGYSWEASIWIDGAKVSARMIDGTVAEDWTAWIVNVSKVAAGNHALAFRLTFKGPNPSTSFPIVEAEIPAFYIDKIAVASSTGPIILNQIPDPTQGASTGTPPPVATPIDFDIVDFGTDGINAGTINVDINGSHAILNGVFQTGYSGTLTSPTADTTHVHIVQTAPFPSASTVTVSAAARTNTSNTPLVANPTVWTFKVADVDPPFITGVMAEDLFTLRVTWNEPVISVSASGLHDALNPALYAVTPQIEVGGTVPAVTPNVISVVEISSTQFDLTTDIELTPGVEYALVTSDVADLAGNHVLRSFAFDSFVPPAPAKRQFDLYRMLPLQNRVEDMNGARDLLRFVSCFQEVLGLLLYSIDKWTDIIDIDRAPEAFVDGILSDLGNPFPFVLTLTQKRKLAHTLVAIYEEKGTPDGIINVIRFFLGIDVTISAYDGEGLVLGESLLGVDWVLGPGTSFARYSYRIFTPAIEPDDVVEKIRIIALYMQPCHTHLIEVVQPFPAPIYDPIVLGVSELGVDWTLH